MNITTIKVVTDNGRRLDIYAIPSRLASQILEQAMLAATVRECHEGWLVTTVDGTDAYPRGDRGHAICHALGITEHPTAPAAPPPSPPPGRQGCRWCGQPTQTCPDPAGHDRADRASETTHRLTTSRTTK